MIKTKAKKTNENLHLVEERFAKTDLLYKVFKEIFIDFANFSIFIFFYSLEFYFLAI